MNDGGRVTHDEPPNERGGREAKADLDRLLDAMGAELASRLERKTRRRPWLAWTGGMVAAAAVAAAVWFGSPGTRLQVDGDGSPAEGATEAALDAGLDVEASGSFVVFPTSNEDITVIWLLGEG
jgi:hypothetical protein